MTIQRFLIVLMKWLAAFALAAGIVMLIRLFCIESYRISTDSMEEALHKGDYILVNKIPGKNKPVRGKVVLFTSPLSRDSADAPLFISRCIGMPGDTIRVSMDGYTINGQKIPRSPRSLCSYFITLSAKETFLETLEKLDIPLRDFRQESFGCMLSLTAFEEYQLREELPDAINRHFIGEQMQEYMLIVPRKDRAYPPPRSPPARRSSCGRRMVKLPSVTESYIWTGGRLISSFSNKTTIGYCPIIPTRR